MAWMSSPPAGNGTITFADGTTAVLTANTPIAVANAVSVTLANNGIVTFAGSAGLGQQTGTLHIRAPQTADNHDLQVKPIEGEIEDASQIIIEGYAVYQAAGNTISGTNSAVASQILANWQYLRRSEGNHDSGLHRHAQPPFFRQPRCRQREPIRSVFQSGHDRAGRRDRQHVRSDAERQLGPRKLQIRPEGDRGRPHAPRGGKSDLQLQGQLERWLRWNFAIRSLGHAIAARGKSVVVLPGSSLAPISLPPINHQVQPLANTRLDERVAHVGQRQRRPADREHHSASFGHYPDFYQTIRTGTGSNDIAAGRDVQFLNPIATIYTAGTQAPAMAEFSLPILNYHEHLR